MVGVANRAGAWKIFKSITFGRAAGWVMTRQRILCLFVRIAIKTLIDKDALYLVLPSKTWTRRLSKSMAHKRRQHGQEIKMKISGRGKWPRV
jgi:hypothetical protein